MTSKLITLSVTIALLLGGLAWMALRTSELQIYPGKDYYLYAYSDQIEGGSSVAQVSEVEQTIQFIYRLGAGYTYPYAGMGLDLTTKDLLKNPVKFLNFSKYDSLKITARSTLSDELRIQILTHDPELSKPNSALSFRHLSHHTPVDRRWQTYSVAIGDFAIPEWWFAANNLKADPGNKYLERVSNLDLQNTNRMLMGFADTVEIKEIYAVGRNTALGWSLLVLGVLFLGGATTLRRLEQHNASVAQELHQLKNRDSAFAQSRKLPLDSQSQLDTDAIITYLGEHYLDSDLDLEQVCKATGINRNRLTHLLRSEMGLTFKAYLTELRLKEAGRLLQNTDLQVAEISLQVGFANISTFNRSFKDFFNTTPNEFRKLNA